MVRRLLAHHPVAVPIAHVPVRRMVPPHRGNAVPPRLLAGDAAVAVVVIAHQRLVIAVSLVPARVGCGKGRKTTLRMVSQIKFPCSEFCVAMLR